MKNVIDLTYSNTYALNDTSACLEIDTYIDLDINNQLPNQLTFTAENLVFNYDKSFYLNMIKNNPKLQEYGTESDSIILSRCQITITGIKGYEIELFGLGKNKFARYFIDCKIEKGDFYFHFIGINAKYAHSKQRVILIFTGKVFISFEDDDILCNYINNGEIFLSDKEIYEVNIIKEKEVINKKNSLKFVTTGLKMSNDINEKRHIFYERLSHIDFSSTDGYVVAKESEE